jgi:hypothetical protein
MAQRFHVIVLARDDSEPRMLTPHEVLRHARAEHFRNKYRNVMSVVIVQVVLTAVMTFLGAPAGSVLIGILGGALAVGGSSCLAAWATRKDLIE